MFLSKIVVDKSNYLSIDNTGMNTSKHHRDLEDTDSAKESK